VKSIDDINDELDRIRDQMRDRPEFGHVFMPKGSEKPVYGYAGTDVVGRTAEITQSLESFNNTDKTLGGRLTDNKIYINDFLGIYTRPSRVGSPLGALESVKNFNFNSKPPSMSMRTGMTDYATTFVDVAGSKTLASTARTFHLSTESPSATNIDIIFGAVSGGTKYIFQKPFFHGSSTATDSYVCLGDALVDEIKGYTGGAVIFTGGVNSANFYKNWILYNSTKADVPILITGSSYGSGDTTLTLSENAPTDWSNGDTIVLYRHFHDNMTFSPSYSDVSGRPPTALQQGNAILLSGGMGSTTGFKPIWTGYISKTFFLGATNNTGGHGFQETYVTEAEVKSTNGITVSTGSTSSDATVLPDGRWFFCIVPETDDGMRGMPIYASTKYVDTTTDKFSFTVTVYPGTLNKRFRYLNVFLGIAPSDTDTEIDWNYLYYIQQLDLCGSSWTWTKAADAPGYYITDALSMDGDVWNSKSSESLVSHLGHTLCTSTTASFSVGKFVNNRLFIAKYYDYISGQDYLDQIRYTDFAGNGRPQLNKLCNLDAYTQSTIEQGDATSVQKLLKWEDKLFVLKDRSCYYIPVSSDVSQWQLITVSNKIGCRNPDTAIETPFMIVWCQTGEDVYGWTGSSPFSLTQNWLTTFQALDLSTNSTTAWYNDALRTYSFAYNTSGLCGYYSMFFEARVPNGFKWGQNEIGGLADATTTYKIFSSGSRSGTVYLNVEYMFNTTFKIVYFDSTKTTDAGIAITPYFKTTEFAFDEINILKILKSYLALTPTTGVGVLSNKITIGSNSATYSDISKTATLLIKGVPFTANSGRKVQFEFNMYTYKVYYASLDVFELIYDYELMPFIGDNTVTI